MGIFVQSHLVDHTAAHGEGRDAGCTDHRVQFFAFGQEQVQQLCKQHAACGIKNEGYQTQCKDEQGIGPDKLVSGPVSANRSPPAMCSPCTVNW